MLGCIKKQFQKYKHPYIIKTQDSPFPASHRKYATKGQHPIKEDASFILDKAACTEFQNVFEKIIYYAHAIDSIFPMALGFIVSEQAYATKRLKQ